MSSSQDRPRRLSLGGLTEEISELVRTPFETDEYRRKHLKSQARIVELLERRAGLRPTTTVVQTGEETSVEVNLPGGAIHRHDTGVNVNSGSVEEQFTIPEEASNITINVDDADGSFNVSVLFLDENGKEITRRDEGNRSAYSGDSTTDVFVQPEVASPFVKVIIEGSANNLDYTLYAR